MNWILHNSVRLLVQIVVAYLLESSELLMFERPVCVAGGEANTLSTNGVLKRIVDWIEEAHTLYH